MIFRTLSERTTGTSVSYSFPDNAGLEQLTFFFANVFQGKCESGILSLHNSNFSECTLSDDSQEAEMVEVD